MNVCIVCGHLEGDHGNGYCTKASGGPCICIRYTPQRNEAGINHTEVSFDVAKEEAITLLNSILLRLHGDDVIKEYDLIADALDRLHTTT